MEIKIISCVPVQGKDGNTFYRVFGQCPDGTVGNIWSGKQYKVGDSLNLAIGIDKNCKFVVRLTNR